MSDTTVVSREQTQLKLDRRAPIAAKYMADTPYTPWPIAWRTVREISASASF